MNERFHRIWAIVRWILIFGSVAFVWLYYRQLEAHVVDVEVPTPSSLDQERRAEERDRKEAWDRFCDGEELNDRDWERAWDHMKDHVAMVRG